MESDLLKWLKKWLKDLFDRLNGPFFQIFILAQIVGQALFSTETENMRVVVLPLIVKLGRNWLGI